MPETVIPSNLSSMVRKDFVDNLNFFVHPSAEVSNPEQLKGRDAQLNQLRDAFETNGLNAFVWGLRGVGKTSLVHTACQKFSDSVRLAAAVSCEKNSSFNDLLNDIFRRVISGSKVNISDKKLTAELSAFGVSISGQKPGFREKLEVSSVNNASDFLNTILPADHDKGREWIIIVDEFDQLENKQTIDSFTALAKQISVDKLPIKFVFCGVAANLNDLIGSHESVDRYLKAIELPPLLDGYIMEIVDYISFNFHRSMSRGQVTRIAQIACGYPHFAHVIMNEILRTFYDSGAETTQVTPEIYKVGVQKAAKGAATRLQNAYDNATKKGSDKYIEVLWAVADGQLLGKQYKAIKDDYVRIMQGRKGRAIIEDDQQFRNHLNSLCASSHGEVVAKGKVGWYHFRDPMLRSYVRMIAHSSDADLGEESFRL